MPEQDPGSDPGKQLSYEEARDELVEVVRRLEQGGDSLAESIALWECPPARRSCPAARRPRPRTHAQQCRDHGQLSELDHHVERQRRGEHRKQQDVDHSEVFALCAAN